MSELAFRVEMQISLSVLQDLEVGWVARMDWFTHLEQRGEIGSSNPEWFSHVWSLSHSCMASRLIRGMCCM